MRGLHPQATRAHRSSPICVLALPPATRSSQARHGVLQGRGVCQSLVPKVRSALLVASNGLAMHPIHHACTGNALVPTSRYSYPITTVATRGWNVTCCALGHGAIALLRPARVPRPALALRRCGGSAGHSMRSLEQLVSGSTARAARRSQGPSSARRAASLPEPPSGRPQRDPLACDVRAAWARARLLGVRRRWRSACSAQTSCRHG